MPTVATFDAIRGYAVRAIRSRKAISVFAGNGLGQVTALLAVPLIARLFNAAAVGAFGLFSSVTASLAVVACLALDQAIPLTGTRREARALEAVSALVLAGSAVAIALVLLALAPLHLDRFRVLQQNAALLPAAVLLTGLVQIAIQSATQRRDFDALSRGFAVRTGGTALLQVAIAFVWSSGTGMIVAQMLAVCMALASLGGEFRGRLPPWRELRAAWTEHRNCPRYLAPRLAVGAVGEVGVLLLVSGWFRPQEVGYYWMAGRLLQVPAGFIDAPMRQLFMSAALEARARTGRFGSVLLAASAGLLAVGGSVIAVLLLFGHPLFRTVLGAQWEAAVPYVQVIAVGWAFDFATIPFSNAVLLLGLQRQHFIFDMIQRVLVLAGIGIGCVQDNLLLGCGMAAAVRAVLVSGFGSYLFVRALARPPRARRETAVPPDGSKRGIEAC